MGDFNFDSERNFHRASGHSAGYDCTQSQHLSQPLSDLQRRCATVWRRPGAVPLENDNIATHYPDYVDVWPTLRPGSL
jgi:hypothetical protein